MSDSKSGSKNDLNESNMPLLEDEQKSGETPEKEQIELEEKDDSKTEKDKKKAKKEKKVKEPKEKKPKGPCKIDVMSEGLNLGARDGKDINTEINLGFDDVIAEPNSAQGFDAIWKLSFVVFSQTKLWLYRLFAAVVAIPASIFWGFVFAFVTVFYVWFASPALRLFDFGTFCFRRVWNGLIHATIEPVFGALGAVFSRMNVHQKRHIVQDA
jgi:hypothetical protein